MIYHKKPKAQFNKKKNLGRVHVYTGEGKGKTTAALGLTMRALGHGYNVLILQFLKGHKEAGEIKLHQALAEKLAAQFTLLQFARPEPVDLANPSAMDIYLVQQGLDYARRAMAEARPDLLVLDEINPAMHYGLIPSRVVLDFLDNKHAETEVVLTGRYAPKEILDFADLVSVIQTPKHYYQRQFPVRYGIEI